MVREKAPFEGIITRAFDTVREWEIGRQPIVGSSDIAAIIGYGYADQSEVSIWAEKSGKVDSDWTDNPEKAKWMAMGTAGEPYARVCFEQHTGLTLHFDEKKTIRTNPDYPAFGASLDGWTFFDPDEDLFTHGSELAVVELKIINPRDIWQYLDDELPMKYQIQTIHQMATVNAMHGFLCAVCGTEVIVKYIPRHDELIEQLHIRAERFLEHVKNGTTPPVDGSDATRSVITRMYPTVAPEKVVSLGEEFNGLAQRRDELKSQEKEIKEEYEMINAKIKMQMKDAEFAVQPDGECFRWSSTKRGRTFTRLERVPAAVRKVLREAEFNNSEVK